MSISKELAKVFVKSTDLLEDELNKNKNLSYSIDDVKALIAEWNMIFYFIFFYNCIPLCY